MKMASGLLHHLVFMVVLSVSLASAMPLEDQHMSLMSEPTSGPTDIWDNCFEDLEKRIAYCRNRRLHAVPNNLSRHTLELDLPNNFLPALLNDSFTRYSFLTRLNLMFNNISRIESKAFYPLHFLEDLNMDYNPVGNIGSGEMFRYCGNLQSLSCEYCELTTLPSDLLNRLPKLLDLWLHNNEIAFINLTSCSRQELNIYLRHNRLAIFNDDYFHIPCTLSEINVEINPFQKIDKSFISSLAASKLYIGDEYMSLDLIESLFEAIVGSSIKELHIRFANLANITENFFDALHNVHLTVLELSFVQLEHLYPAMFSQLNRIDELVISDNHINVIEPEYFMGMQNLKILRMDWNKISSINPFRTRWQIGLTELYLIANKLECIDSSYFVGLSNLTHLDLSLNPLLSSVDIRSFGIDKLNTLDLSSTPLKDLKLNVRNLKSFIFDSGETWYADVFIPGETFEDTPYLENINLMASRLTVKDIWDDFWKISLFDGLDQLKALHLSGNEISYLPSWLFEGLRSLETLNLDMCEMNYIEQNVFVGLDKLVVLNLRNNYLKDLPPGMLSDLRQLRRIDIAANDINFLEDDFFRNNTQVQNVLLFKNQFTSLNRTTFDPIKSSVESIDLSNNPFNCTCQMAWLVDWLVVLSQSYKVQNEHKTICEVSEWKSLEKKPLIAFDTFEFCGEHFIGHRNNIPFICVGVLGIMVIYVLVLISYRNRWLLKYKLFLLKTAILGRGDIHDARDRLDFEYDINVIFFDDHEDWVQEHLRPALEEKLPNFDRNVFGGDDLPLGMHYMDATHYVIENSFKTILLLSSAAIRDSWFLIKFRAAVEFDDENNAGKNDIVAIFLDSIPDEELPYVVRLYLSDNRPYLKWVADATGREYFWIELANYLTSNIGELDAAIPH